MLRFRRYFLDKVSRSLGRHGTHQNRFDPENESRHNSLNRLELPHAASGRDRPLRPQDPHDASCRNSGIEIMATIKETVADPRLQLAIYSATQRLIDHRASAVGIKVLPEYQELRTLAHEIKKHTIEHLDYYLEQLEANLVAHGGKVIYCEDAQQVTDFVLDLAKQRNARLIVKSQSMTTEEIHFNERLAHHQLEAVETDLCEFIPQLAAPRPYHIVT